LSRCHLLKLLFRRAETSRAYHTLAEHSFKIARAPEGQTADNLVLLHPSSLQALDALEGDPVILRRGEEELNSQVAPSRFVQPGQAAITQRMRRQVNVEPGQQVSLARLVKRPASQAVSNLTAAPEPALVAHQVNPGRQAQLWLAASDFEQLALRSGQPVNVQGRASMLAVQAEVLLTEHALPLRAAALSASRAAQTGITLGETLHLTQG
jgi:hypothetical protein